MKKGLTIVALVALLFNFSYSQKLSKEDTKRIKDELKEYMKHPETYKAKVDQAQTDKDACQAQVNQLKGELETANASAEDLQKKVTANDEQLKTLQEENDKLKEAANPAPKETASEETKETAPLRSAPSRGTVYKIQLGMYKGFNVNKYFDQQRFIGYEEVDGMNRYVISYFPDEETALKFVNDIRKLGIRDAFVAKYIDGTRVYEWSENPKYKGKKVPNSLEEALGEGGHSSKPKHSKTQDE